MGQVDPLTAEAARKDCLRRMRLAAVALGLDPGLAPMLVADAAVIWPVVTLLQQDSAPPPPRRVGDLQMILALLDLEREVRRFLCQSVIDAPARTPAGMHAKRRLIQHLEAEGAAIELFGSDLSSWTRALRDSLQLDLDQKSSASDFAR